jgi:hypothetical protein
MQTVNESSEEPDPTSCDGLEDGEDGPLPTREEAEVVLIEHCLAAIAQVEARKG